MLDKYPNTQLILLDKLGNCESALRACSARYAAFVAKPEEVDYKLVNTIHRATRKVDDDLWGDCMWGIISAADVASAQRIAEAKKPLLIKSSLSTTGVNTELFEQSFTISDAIPYECLRLNGNERVKFNINPKTSDNKRGVQSYFAEGMQRVSPDMVTTSAHATEYNLEMPFSLGLIFSYGNRFYQLEQPEMRGFGPHLKAARSGDCSGIKLLSEKYANRMIPPNEGPRVWFAVGNCLFGNMNNSQHSMAATALGAYGCNQVVGYTVPTWYGKGGWDALGDFNSSYENLSLSHAWYLNNQFILDTSLKKNPLILKAEFNEPEATDFAKLQQSLVAAGLAQGELDKDCLGLLHDRDVVALYGDPMWKAQLDPKFAHLPLSVSMEGAKQLKIKAKADFQGRFAYWYPQRMAVSQCDVKGATVTNDFILLPALQLKAGKELVIELK